MSLPRRAALALPLCLLSLSPLSAAEPPTPVATTAQPAGTKRVLLVTHSGGFVHDSVVFAEETLKDIGPKSGFAVTCWRLTNTEDKAINRKPEKNGKELPAVDAYNVAFRKSTGKTAGPDSMGRINAETLKNFDCVLFFTTGNPCTPDELKDLLAWVKAGGAFAGTHCATDTLYNTAYGDLIGGYFDGHPWHQKVTLKVDDAAHPAMKGFKTGDTITDEIYQFKDFSKAKLHELMVIDTGSIDVKKGKRADGDYAVSWAKDYGSGKVFYTSLGHRKDVWKDPRFQAHLIAGLKWATGSPVAATTAPGVLVD